MVDRVYTRIDVLVRKGGKKSRRGDRCEWVRVTFHKHEKTALRRKKKKKNEEKIKKKRERSMRVKSQICICNITLDYWSRLFNVLSFNRYHESVALFVPEKCCFTSYTTNEVRYIEVVRHVRIHEAV